jgi:hypothetical protein
MSKAISPWDFPQSPAAYKAWALSLGQACSRRQKLARPTSGAGSSFWPTPLVQMGGNRNDMRVDGQGLRFPAYAHQKGRQTTMLEIARSWTLLWLLMKTLGMRAGPMPAYPYSRPLHVTLWAGSRYSAGDLICNPAFLDWTMGWPPGWSDPASPVTGFAQWLRQSRTELSRVELLGEV